MESSEEKPVEENIVTTEEGEKPPRKKGKHKKDKPWDNENIDHWKIDAFNRGDMQGALLEESSFATLFPKYRKSKQFRAFCNFFCLKSTFPYVKSDI